MGILGLVTLAMLTAPDVKRINFKALDFHVNASDRLYFRNLRLFYYLASDTENNQFERLVLKADGAQEEEVRFEILNNWRFDEAYIRLALEENEDDVLLGYHRGEERVWQLKSLNAEDHLIMAGELFEVLQVDTAQVYLKKEELTIPIWQQTESRSAALTVLKDYFRLIGGLR